MPTRQGGRLASLASSCTRESFRRRMMAPRSLRPTSGRCSCRCRSRGRRRCLWTGEAWRSSLLPLTPVRHGVLRGAPPVHPISGSIAKCVQRRAGGVLSCASAVSEPFRCSYFRLGGLHASPASLDHCLCVRHRQHLLCRPRRSKTGRLCRWQCGLQQLSAAQEPSAGCGRRRRPPQEPRVQSDGAFQRRRFFARSCCEGLRGRGKGCRPRPILFRRPWRAALRPQLPARTRRRSQ